MASAAVTAEVRRALGPVGAFVGMSGPPVSVDHQREGIRRLERSGFRAVWTNEIVGADALVRATG